MMKKVTLFQILTLALIISSVSMQDICAQETKLENQVFSKNNLAAWCIVPFDSEKRNPEERAKMLHELGITKFAYDWRDEHIPTFDEELQALNKYGVKLEGFWTMSGFNPDENESLQEIFAFIERNQVKTQLWLMMTDMGEEFEALDQVNKVKKIAVPLRKIAERAAKLGCTVGLYNHEGWYGEPENQLEIIEFLKMPNVGIVYNFHHARSHHQRFSEFFPKIMPYLLALNIAGLKEGDTENFYRTGKGNVEVDMIRIVFESDYSGTIGILNHDEKEDAKKGLSDEVKGLQKILKKIGAEETLKTYKD